MALQHATNRTMRRAAILCASTLPLLLLASAETTSDAKSPVVAYLFTLRRARHPLPRVWSMYFAGCPRGSYRIHLHTDPTFNGTAKTNATNRFFAPSRMIPRSTHIRRFGYEMVNARMLLLRHAMIAESSPPDWFFYFSESCAPISHCHDAHAYLAKSAGKSFMKTRPPPPEERDNTPAWQAAFKTTCPRCAEVGIPPTDFRYSPGWVGLWRDHAKMLSSMRRSIALPSPTLGLTSW